MIFGGSPPENTEAVERYLNPDQYRKVLKNYLETYEIPYDEYSFLVIPIDYERSQALAKLLFTLHLNVYINGENYEIEIYEQSPTSQQRPFVHRLIMDYYAFLRVQRVSSGDGSIIYVPSESKKSRETLVKILNLLGNDLEVVDDGIRIR